VDKKYKERKRKGFGKEFKRKIEYERGKKEEGLRYVVKMVRIGANEC